MLSIPNDADETLDNLWLGNIKVANDPVFFRNHNIDTVINCTDDIPFPDFYSSYHIQAVRFPLSSVDTKKNNYLLARKIDDVERILNDALKRGKHVLVHCFEGRQRSATLIAYHIMKRITSYDCPRTLAFLRKCRPIALTPAPAFDWFFLQKCKGMKK